MTKDALDAVEILENDGIECAVVNVHTIKPIDCEGVKRAARQTGAVLAALACEKVPASVVGVQDRFGEVGKLPRLREVLGLRPEDIVQAAGKAVSQK